MTKSDDNSCVVNYIPEDTIVKGDIIAERNLIIEGRIEGNVISKNRVQIKSKGYVKGNISCCFFYCEGIVEGNVKVSNCSELNNKATIKGTMECAYLITNFDCIIEQGFRLIK